MLNMNGKNLKKCIFIIAVFIFLIPGILSAQTAPEPIVFGEVAVGASDFREITAENDKNDFDITVIFSLKIKNLGFTTDVGQIELSPGEIHKLKLIFSPSEEGDYSNQLTVFYLKSKGYSLLEKINYEVSGIGIERWDPTIKGLFEFYKSAVDSRDLVGYGNGKSADNRINVFGGMLEKAKAAIEAGKIDEGLAHLRAAQEKINVFVVEGKDGNAVVRSYSDSDSEGDTISELKERIKYLLENTK